MQYANRTREQFKIEDVESINTEKVSNILESIRTQIPWFRLDEV